MNQRLKFVNEQWQNYRNLFTWLFKSYYSTERKAFWWTQLLMGLATVAGFLWMSGTLMGFAHQQGAVTPARLAFLNKIYQLHFWHWLSIFSVAGLLSAYAFYWSFRAGVESALRYQKKLVHAVISASAELLHGGYANSPNNNPNGKNSKQNVQVKGHLLRLVKSNTHVTGHVSRMLTRSIIPLLTSLVGALTLLYLDPVMTLILIPILIIYVVGLYYINKHAADVSADLLRTSREVNPGINALFNLTREEKNAEGGYTFLDSETALENSGYEELSRLKYQRRLVNIHINWLKTVLLVIAILLMSAWFMMNHEPNKPFDWPLLVLYLIVLRFTANALATVGMATVVFSRFYPDMKALKEYLDNPEAALQCTQVGSGDLSDGDTLDFEDDN